MTKQGTFQIPSKLTYLLRIVTFALIILCYAVVVKAHFPVEDFPQANVAEQIQAIIDHTINQQYDGALQICQRLQKQYPQHPVGFFFEAATLQALMLDDENDESKEGFFELTSKVNKLCKSALRSDPKNSWLYFFMGGALGYEAYFLGREQKYLKAFSDGWNSIQSLETAIALDSTNYDAYLGIGTYKYYRSKLSKYLNWLPFVRDEKKTGIEMIKLAIERGKFSRAAAMNALIWIYIGEKKYAQADVLLDTALKNYPNSRFFLWGKATIATEQNNWRRAEVVYKKILQSYAREGKRSFYNELLCHARLAEIYAKRNNSELASKHAQQALTIKIKKPMRKKARKHQKLAEQILKQNSYSAR